MWRRNLRQVVRRCFYVKKTLILTVGLVFGVFIFMAKDDVYHAVHAVPDVHSNVTQFSFYGNMQPKVGNAGTGSLNSQTTTSKQSGEQNAQFTAGVCSQAGFTSRSTQGHITARFNKQRSVMFCPIYKVGSTFWRRIFMIDGESKYRKLVDPFVIPFDKEYAASKYALNSSRTGFTFMFTRDPYMRLFSFYVDKLLAPNPYYWKVVGIKAARLANAPASTKQCGHDVTFKDFIKYAIHTLKSQRIDVDPHWVEMERNCRLCDIKYDFIGKMESFADDADKVLVKMGMNATASHLRVHGSALSNDDAIKDTVVQPFSFRTKYRTCMTFKQAVHRSWTKLQIRGLIGPGSAPENISESGTWSDLYEYAWQSSQSSDKAARKKLKLDALREHWAHIDIGDLQQLKRLYARDFALFGYNEEPDIVYQGRGASTNS